KAGVRVGELHAAIEHHVAHDAAAVPARLGVVADVGHAVGGEVAAADVQHARLHLFRHPGVHPVADDVVELADVLRDVEDVEVAQLDVFHAERLDGLPAVGDLARGGVDAQAGASRVDLGDGHEVAAHGAAELQHPAAGGVRRLQPENAGHGGQAVGMGFREGQAGVGDGVVGRLVL